LFKINNDIENQVNLNMVTQVDNNQSYNANNNYNNYNSNKKLKENRNISQGNNNSIPNKYNNYNNHNNYNYNKYTNNTNNNLSNKPPQPEKKIVSKPNLTQYQNYKYNNYNLITKDNNDIKRSYNNNINNVNNLNSSSKKSQKSLQNTTYTILSEGIEDLNQKDNNLNFLTIKKSSSVERINNKVPEFNNYKATQVINKSTPILKKDDNQNKDNDENLENQPMTIQTSTPNLNLNHLNHLERRHIETEEKLKKIKEDRKLFEIKDLQSKPTISKNSKQLYEGLSNSKNNVYDRLTSKMHERKKKEELMRIENLSKRTKVEKYSNNTNTNNRNLSSNPNNSKNSQRKIDYNSIKKIYSNLFECRELDNKFNRALSENKLKNNNININNNINNTDNKTNKVIK